MEWLAVRCFFNFKFKGASKIWIWKKSENSRGNSKIKRSWVTGLAYEFSLTADMLTLIVSRYITRDTRPRSKSCERRPPWRSTTTLNSFVTRLKTSGSWGCTTWDLTQVTRSFFYCCREYMAFYCRHFSVPILNIGFKSILVTISIVPSRSCELYFTSFDTL